MDNNNFKINRTYIRDRGCNEVVMRKILTLNHYLGNKKTMYDILSNDNRAFKFLPLTATFNTIESDWRSVINHAMSYDKSMKTWILKPAEGLQGRDIFISSNIQDVVNFVVKNPKYKDWVLSHYIDNPFLLKLNGKPESGVVFNDKIGRKTHIRIYVLVTKIDNEVHVYLYDSSLIFCAVAEYRPDDLKYEYSNLTNLNLANIYYDKVFKKDGKLAYKELSFPVKETLANVFGEKFYDKVVFPQIKEMLEVIFENAENDNGNYLQCDNKCPGKTCVANRGCFQYIAIDIMPVKENFKLYLLEINGGPGLNAPKYHWGGTNEFYNGILAKVRSLLEYNENDDPEFIKIK
jgi:hypothetical protein